MCGIHPCNTSAGSKALPAANGARVGAAPLAPPAAASSSGRACARPAASHSLHAAGAPAPHIAVRWKKAATKAGRGGAQGACSAPVGTTAQPHAPGTRTSTRTPAQTVARRRRRWRPQPNRASPGAASCGARRCRRRLPLRTQPPRWNGCRQLRQQLRPPRLRWWSLPPPHWPQPPSRSLRPPRGLPRWGRRRPPPRLPRWQLPGRRRPLPPGPRHGRRLQRPRTRPTRPTSTGPARRGVGCMWAVRWVRWDRGQGRKWAVRWVRWDRGQGCRRAADAWGSIRPSSCTPAALLTWPSASDSACAGDCALFSILRSSGGSVSPYTALSAAAPAADAATRRQRGEEVKARCRNRRPSEPCIEHWASWERRGCACMRCKHARSGAQGRWSPRGGGGAHLR